MHPSDSDVRAMLRRAQLVSLDDSGAQQLLDLSGFKGDRPRKVPMVTLFGFASSPPAGASFLLLSPGGGSDALAIGGEHGDYRPKNTPPGGTIIYDAHGSAISLVEQAIRVVHATEVVIETPLLTINAPMARFNGQVVFAKGFEMINEDGLPAPARVTGSIHLTNDLLADGDVKSGSHSLNGHVHSGVPGGNTGGPVG